MIESGSQLADSGCWVLEEDELGPPSVGGIGPMNQQALQLVAVAGVESPSSFWSDFNARQRGNTKTFVTQQPRSNLVILLATMKPQVDFMQHLLYLSSDKWEREQEALEMSGQPRHYRVELAATGRLCDRFWEKLSSIWGAHDIWCLLEEADRNRRNASISFSLLARAGGGVFFHFAHRHRGYPWKLWQLLTLQGPDKKALAHMIINVDPDCLKCHFTLRFLRQFPTVEALMSASCHLVLRVLAVLLRIDISRIECRHAWIRRFSQIRAQTHSADVAQLSSDFLLMRARQSAVTHRSTPDDHGDTDEPAKKKSRGGPQRAYFSERMQEGETDFTVLHREYSELKAAGGERYNKLVESGYVATVAGRGGARRVFVARHSDCAPPVREAQEAPRHDPVPHPAPPPPAPPFPAAGQGEELAAPEPQPDQRAAVVFAPRGLVSQADLDAKIAFISAAQKEHARQESNSEAACCRVPCLPCRPRQLGKAKVRSWMFLAASIRIFVYGCCVCRNGCVNHSGTQFRSCGPGTDLCWAHGLPRLPLH